NIILAMMVFLFLGSCCPRGWGVSLWERMGKAAAEATVSPGTWVPLLCAGAVYATGVDKKLSAWAAEHTPLFGSQENARRWSDLFAGGAAAAQYFSALAAPPPDPSANAAAAKLRNVAVGFAANGLNYAATGALKSLVPRSRPDGSGENSFPSGHSSPATLNATLALRLLPSLPLPEISLPYAKGFLVALAAGAGWASVEGNKNYLSDALAGTALGHWIGSFMSLSFYDCRAYTLCADPLESLYTLKVRLLFK
ncbi:MAG: phosphatase PAP2 family protein, partial [Endomicrobiales bacterium]